MDKEISYSGFVRSDDTEPKKNPTRNALDRFTTDSTDTQEKEYVERVAGFMSEDMLKTLDSIRRGLEYKEIADNLREYLD